MQSRAPVALLICSLMAACGDDEGTSSLSAASQTSNNSTAGSVSSSSSSSSSSSDSSTSDGSSGSATGTSAGSETTDASTSSTSTSSGTTTGGGGLCGNGLVDPGEQCDGGNLGSFTCTSLGYDGGGTLSCDPVMCTLDTSMCIGGGGSTSG